MNAQSLSDLSEDSLRVAFNRAHRECKFFPKPSELREMAVGKVADQEEVKSLAAWNWILDFMRKFWHADLGIYQNAPVIPPAIMYALRIIGGFRSLSQMEVSSQPFIQKAFLAAYKLAPVAEMMQPQIDKLLPTARATMRQLADGKKFESPRVEEITVARERMEAKAQREAEDAAARQEAGRKRHEEQVAWLKKRGEI